MINPHISAVLDYESRRRKYQREYIARFIEWKNELSKPLNTLSPIMWENKERRYSSLEMDLIGLVALYDIFGGAVCLSYAVLLRQFQISATRAKEELQLHVEAVLEEIHKTKWLPAIALIKSNWLCAWNTKQQLDDRMLTDKWTEVKHSITEQMEKTRKYLWSSSVRWKDIRDYDQIADQVESQIQATRKNRKKSKGPNEEQKKIIKAIKTGKRGRELCKELDEYQVKSRKTWNSDEIYKWPGSYLAAWNTRGKRAKHWHRQIGIYIQNIKTQFPEKIKITKSL